MRCQGCTVRLKAHEINILMLYDRETDEHVQAVLCDECAREYETGVAA